MGNWIPNIPFIGKKEPLRTLLLGLDAAGKTTILYKMKLGEIVTTIPTIGFNVETLNHKDIEIVAWDLGGRDKARPLARYYFKNTNVFIYVIDSNDRDRILQARDEMHSFLNEDEVKDSIVLIIANKQDLKKALKVDEVKQEIDFDRIKQRYKNVIGTVAHTGEGLEEAFDWIVDAYHKKKSGYLTEPFEETLDDIKSVAHSKTWAGYVKYISLKFINWN